MYHTNFKIVYSKEVTSMAVAQIGFVIVVGLIGGFIGWHASKGDLFD